MLPDLLVAIGLAGVLGFVWMSSGIWLDQATTRRLRKNELGRRPELVSSLARVKPRSLLSRITGKNWALIALVAAVTALFTRQPVLTVGSAVVLYFTAAFFGTDPMEDRIKTMEQNIAWVQTLTYLLQTSKSAWESLNISAKSLPPDTAKELLSALDRANTTTGGYVVRLRDALTLFAVSRGDPQVDMTVAMVNANISSSGGAADYEVMKSIQEQLKAELTEQNAAVSARREIFTIAKIMFPAVVILEALMMVFMGSFIGPYYRSPAGYLVAVLIEAITIALLFLFRKFSAPLAETRLIVPETFQDSLKRQIQRSNRTPAATGAPVTGAGGDQAEETGEGKE